MASATLNSPNSQGPPAPNRARHSAHRSSMRAISAERSGLGAVLRPVARAFMGHCERRIENPECISAHAARATARAARSAGQPRPASSHAYSQIASESQTSSAPCRKHRHAPRGAGGADVTRELRRIERNHALGELEAEVLHEQPWAQRPRRIVLVAHGEQHFVQDCPPITCAIMHHGAIRAICFDLDNTLWEIEPVLHARGAHSRRLARAPIPADPANASLPPKMLEVRAALLAEQPHQAHDLQFLRRETLARCAAEGGLQAGHGARSVRGLACRAQPGRAVCRSHSGARNTQGAFPAGDA